ncbi:hypothetical protein FIV50_14600 [Microbacterium foliorum]|uniref:Uncharacterized protein n=1 Tax=Microbacterium foliorum TaxID=104336 RepID=A0A4Y5YST7_9MICO|nr:hypothetical protein [Microbacterium foliorum]QDE35910.1 hypothetical protein FIV50_14600 [Microbacterium foliorum]
MRTHIEIDGRSFVLHDDQPLPEIMAEIEAAASSSPTFVTLSAEGRSISVLIRSSTRVVISVEKDDHVEPDQGAWDLPFDEWEL